ncbi:MAG: GYD domain-containing protein [Chloroflexota bacterium]|nr:GYD domain-containing protein [Chloroflexota bacterium]
MATYVVLASLTDQGARTMQDLGRRLENARATFKAQGAELKQLYFAMGQYDYVVIAEAPDDETMTRVSLAVSSQGNVRTNSFRVFKEDETLQLMEGLR